MTDSRRVVRRGDVWVAYFDPAVGREQQGRRPAVIISGEELNMIPSELVFVVPATSKDRNMATHVDLVMSEGHLPRDSYAMTEQFRSISHQRLRKRIGSVHAGTLELIVQRLLLLMDVSRPGQYWDFPGSR